MTSLLCLSFIATLTEQRESNRRESKYIYICIYIKELEEGRRSENRRRRPVENNWEEEEIFVIYQVLRTDGKEMESPRPVAE